MVAAERGEQAERVELKAGEFLGIGRAGEFLGYGGELRLHAPRRKGGEGAGETGGRQIPDRPRAELRPVAGQFLAGGRDRGHAGQRGECGTELLHRCRAGRLRERGIGDHKDLALTREAALKFRQPAHAREGVGQQREQLGFQPQSQPRPSTRDE